MGYFDFPGSLNVALITYYHRNLEFMHVLIKTDVCTGEDLLQHKETEAYFIHSHRNPTRKVTHIHTQSQVSDSPVLLIVNFVAEVDLFCSALNDLLPAEAELRGKGEESTHRAHGCDFE